MAALKVLVVLVAVFVLNSASPCAGVEMHHVVGGDRGWDVESNIASWAAGKIFRVGDKIWFAYSAAHGSVVELQSKEDYEACDVSKFVRTYTDGIDIVALYREGIRYFASSKAENCKKGLKVDVQVQAQAQAQQVQAQAQEKHRTTEVEAMNYVSDSDSAIAPWTPSTSAPPITPVSCLAIFLIGLSYWIS